jgi:hypothetical protein
MPVLFPLGKIVATPGALAALERAKQPVPRQNCHQAFKDLSPSKKVQDLQFGYEHFDLFESEEALLHFCSINL